MRRPVRGGPRLKGLNPSGKFPSGNVRYYYRRSKPAIAMPDAAPDSPEFMQAYTDAMNGVAKRSVKVSHRTGSIGAGIRAFLACDEYLGKASSTRASWRRFAEEAEEFFGKASMADLEPQYIRKYLAKFGPHPANNRLKLWRAMGKWWEDVGLVEADPAKLVRRRETPSSDGHEPWTADDVKKFRKHWQIGTMQRLAMEIMLQTGAAIGDAIRLGPANMKGDWLTYQRGKTDTTCTVPLFAANRPAFYPEATHLKACLAAAPKHMTWLSTKSGASRSPKAAAQWFSAAASKAGIEGKTAHGLRKYLSVHMAERGATQEQRMAILGHETSAQTRHYSKSADAMKIISGTDFANFSEPVGKSAKKGN